MAITVSWEQIGLRILLALAASFVIGYDRDQHGKTSGIRTTMLVCLAAALAMLQANLLLGSAGKAAGFFAELDPMRLPQGILSGIGFIGAGAILRKGGLVHGLTTAATLWLITVLGLLFGGGQLALGIAGTVITLLILRGLKALEEFLPAHSSATLCLELAHQAATPTLLETELRSRLHRAGYIVSKWCAQYQGASLRTITCELHWPSKGGTEPATPPLIHDLANSAAVAKLSWES